MARSFLIAMLLVGATCVPLGAQQAETADAKAVWALIESSGETQPKVTDDIIFVAGPYPRPIIGRDKFEARDRGKRLHIVLKDRPQKVVVAKGGDMAYGFSLFDMEFDQSDSAGKLEHVKFEGSQLTVWRKVGGEWRVAASFNRPNE